MATNKTPVSQLQELMVARKLPLPTYIEGPIESPFKCTVIVGGITAVGRGSTKKEAKHHSAELAFLQLKSHSTIGNMQLSSCIFPSKIVPRNNLFSENLIGELNEFASKNGLPYPIYSLLLQGPEFGFQCDFNNSISKGYGKNKKDAKQNCAREMLRMLKDVKQINKTIKSAIQIPTKTDIDLSESTERDTDKIIKLYNSLSLQSNLSIKKPQQSSTSTSNFNNLQFDKDTYLNEDMSIDELEILLKLKQIHYSIKYIQSNPCIACFTVDNSNLTLLGVGSNKHEAKVNVLKEVVQLYNIGFNFNDSILQRN